MNRKTATLLAAGTVVGLGVAGAAVLHMDRTSAAPIARQALGHGQVQALGHGQIKVKAIMVTAPRALPRPRLLPRPQPLPEVRPDLPTALRQETVHGKTVQAIASGAWVNSGHVRLSVRLSSPQSHARLQAQVELHPLATAFTGHAGHSGAAVSYRGRPVTATVDVAGLPDGAYHWQARVHDLDGPTSAWVSGGVFHVYRGRPAAPAVRLATPQQGGWVATRHVAFRWAPVYDPSGIAGYAFTLTRNPAARAAEAWPLPGTRLSTHAAGDGTWYFSVRARNKAGSWGAPARLVVHVAMAAPRLDDLSVPGGAINPRHTPTVARMRLAHTSRVVVRIANASGHVVRVIPTHLHPAGYRMTIGWDGLDAQGHTVRNGVYQLRIAAYNQAGVTWQTTHSLRVEIAPPSFTGYGLTQPYSYNPYDNDLDGAETITATLDEPATMRLDLVRADHSVARTWILTATTAGQPLTATWDGTGADGALLASGAYTLRATVTDEAGNTATQTLGTVSLDLRRIVVSLAQQRLWAMDGNRVLMTTLVTTGGPELPTPTGDFQIIDRESPFTFHSPYPPGSPYWYADSPVTFALLFQVNGYFIHDAPWRSYYGPGSNDVYGAPGTNTGGSHGCVNVPYSPMSWLYPWATMYTPVQVRQDWSPSAA